MVLYIDSESNRIRKHNSDFGVVMEEGRYLILGVKDKHMIYILVVKTIESVAEGIVIESLINVRGSRVAIL